VAEPGDPPEHRLMFVSEPSALERFALRLPLVVALRHDESEDARRRDALPARLEAGGDVEAVAADVRLRGGGLGHKPLGEKRGVEAVRHIPEPCDRTPARAAPLGFVLLCAMNAEVDARHEQFPKSSGALNL